MLFQEIVLVTVILIAAPLAVVDVHPFGGLGLSGTGSNAGGSNYLESFITEKTITNNIVAVGSNADLLESIDGWFEKLLLNNSFNVGENVKISYVF